MNKIVSLFCIASLFAMLFSCSQSEQKTTESEKSVPSFDEVIKTRRSVRSYDSTKTITQEQVKELLISTQEAPSWANQQPTKYYVAITPEKVKAVVELTGPNKEKIAGAPVVIVSTYERGKSGFFQGNQTNEIGDGWGAYDNGLSNAYLILKARAMGFDTLIMGLRDAKELRSLLSIPNEETVMAVISLGYRAEEPKQPQHRPLEEIVRFY
jgi:nitroreductase